METKSSKMSVLKTKENSAVQAHINMLQGVINRMASNSTNCKTWAVTILSAMLVLYVDDKIKDDDLWICYMPVILFLFLDCFYLGWERQLIKKQTSLVDKINNGDDDFETDLFMVKGSSPTSQGYLCIVCKAIGNFWKQLWNTFLALFSFTSIVFYGGMIVFIWFLINKNILTHS